VRSGWKLWRAREGCKGTTNRQGRGRCKREKKEESRTIVNKGKREGWRKVREGKKVRETRSERVGWRKRAERSMRSLDQSRDRIDEMSRFDWCA